MTGARSALARRTLGLAIALALAGCGREPGSEILVTTVRLVDLVRPSRTVATERGVDVTLGRDIRRALALPASTFGLAKRDGTAARYRMDMVPPAALAWHRVRLLRKASVGGRTVDVPALTVDMDAAMPELGAVPLELIQPQVVVSIVAAPPGRMFSIDTRPFTVPAGAVLRFDAGVYAAGIRPRTPVGARVTVLDGDALVPVWRANLDGTQAAWNPEHVSLASFAGRRIRMRFTTRPGKAIDEGVVAAFGEPVVLAPERRPVRPFNVVLVSMDTLRARSVGAYGAERPTTPTLDAMAADGVLFENAFSSAAFTLPGHMSMLTGLWFSSHRAITAHTSLALDRRTLAEALQGRGYATAAFTSGAWIMPWTGFRRGFDTYFEQAPTAYVPDAPGGIPYEAFTRGLEWLRRNADRPCFLFLHSYLVHGPYIPPEPYRRAFQPLPPWASEDERLRLAYDQEVRYGDDQIRALLEGLDALGLSGRTLVVVTADHGEQFGEHGAREHTHDVHDEVAQVPLIMRLPGALPARRVAEPVSLADIAPTVLDLLGLPPIADTDGASLLPLAAGTTDRLPRDGVFTEAESEPRLGWVDLTAIRTRSHTCIHYARRDGYECYDRRVDPWEHTPLAADDPSPDAQAARAAIARFRAAMPPPGTPPDAAAAAPAPPPPVEGTPRAGAVDEERQKQLRDLGYIE